MGSCFSKTQNICLYQVTRELRESTKQSKNGNLDGKVKPIRRDIFKNQLFSPFEMTCSMYHVKKGTDKFLK